MVTGEHTIKQYDQELESLRGRILQMGGLVESQLRMAIDCFEQGDLRKADEVVEADEKVDDEELELGRLIVNLIVRRQPAANDLRLIMGVSRAVTDLERIGDEATKIARAARWVHEKDVVVRTPRIRDIRVSAEVALSMLRGALDAFARLDAVSAAEIIREDAGVDEQFRLILRQLITFMMEDPRTITGSLDTVWVAKAIERIGDHSKNIAGDVIFIVQGEDVRHATLEQLARAVSQPT
ncbi:MAG TPA: phosphate signaling complex protein PhoU [Burkholderiaceae bacterium]|jgi:phosphate transport system protein|nr:phosphate signaling complex protein PhoU [Burkholderiaceae bacterium]